MNKEKEIETVTLMVRRYCRGVHGTRGETLCPACAALLEDARERRDRCPHGKKMCIRDSYEARLAIVLPADMNCR